MEGVEIQESGVLGRYVSEGKRKMKEKEPWNGAFEWRFKHGERSVIEHLVQENILCTFNLICGMLSSQSKQQGAESEDEYIQQQSCYISNSKASKPRYRTPNPLENAPFMPLITP